MYAAIPSADMVVIGGGLIGAASAVRLQTAGARVMLIEPGDERARASFGNATLIANHLTEPLAAWKIARAAPGRLFAFGGPLDFVWKDVDFWAGFAARYLVACARFERGCAALSPLMAEALPAWRRLLSDAGRPELLDEAAQWLAWEDARRFAREAAALKSSDTGPVVPRDLTPAEVARLQAVSPLFTGGLAMEGSAKLTDPAEVVRALHAAFVTGGGEILEGRVDALRDAGDGLNLRLADGQQLRAGRILIAAGARSRELARQVGMHAPLVAERGYHLQYAEHDLPADAAPLICDERWIIVTRAGSGVRVTSFTEIGRPESPPDARKWAALERHVADLGLAVRGEPERWIGCRPTLPDFLPAIGRNGRVLYAFGHQHVGLTLAAITGELVAELAAHAETPETLKPFDLKRFA